jgi:hypothetical protein
MPHHPMAVLMAAALVCLACAASAHGDGPPATMPATVTITGVVKAAAPAAEEAATVQADKQLYKIVKDAKGKIVAHDAAGKKAEIRGAVTERHGVKWITVTWCALVE